MTATMRRSLLDDWPAVRDTGSRWDGQAEASAHDGVLEILVPKAPEAQTRPVRVRVSQDAAS
jgi:hypothetical protein